MSDKTPQFDGRRRKWLGDDHYFLKLWTVVSLLWTAATLFRIVRVWVPIEGWRSVVSGPWLWLEVSLPPLMFGIVILAVRQLIKRQGSARISLLPRCRRSP
jgi:hypothetical protein